MAYKYKSPKPKKDTPYIFLLRNRFKNKSRENIIKRREYLKIKIKEGINTGDEFDEYLDLSHLIYTSEMIKSKSFREKVYAGEI